MGFEGIFDHNYRVIQELRTSLGSGGCEGVLDHKLKKIMRYSDSCYLFLDMFLLAGHCSGANLGLEGF